MAILTAAVFAIVAPDPKTREADRRHEDQMGSPPRSLVVLLVGGFFAAASGNSISLFFVPSSVHVGIAEATAGLILAGCSLLVVAVRITAGWTVDRRASSGHLEMAALMGVGASVAVVLGAISSIPPYLVLAPIALLGSWGWPGLFFFTAVTSYARYPARVSGLVLSVNLTGTVIGPLIVGALVGGGRYSIAWYVVGCAGLIAATAFLVSRTLIKRESGVSI